MSTPLSDLSREELEAALAQFGETMKQLKPVLEAAAKAVADNIEPFMTSVMELKKTQPWLFEIEQMPSYDFDGNDLDAGEPEAPLTPHEFLSSYEPDGTGHKRTDQCQECGRPELHFIHDEPEVQAPISIEELEEQAERRLLRGKGS